MNTPVRTTEINVINDQEIITTTWTSGDYTLVRIEREGDDYIDWRTDQLDPNAPIVRDGSKRSDAEGTPVNYIVNCAPYTGTAEEVAAYANSIQAASEAAKAFTAIRRGEDNAHPHKPEMQKEVKKMDTPSTPTTEINIINDREITTTTWSVGDYSLIRIEREGDEYIDWRTDQLDHHAPVVRDGSKRSDGEDVPVTYIVNCSSYTGTAEDVATYAASIQAASEAAKAFTAIRRAEHK